MKRLLLIPVLLFAFAISGSDSVQASAARMAVGQVALPLCLPGEVSASCQALGPAAYLAEQEQQGFTFPLKPLPSYDPDPALAALPYYYAKVTADSAPVFSTPEEAAEGKVVKRYFPPGFIYVTILDTRVVEGKTYYMIEPGEWMRRKDISLGISTSLFSGKHFYGTPERKFGWVLLALETQKEPGLSSQYTDKYYSRWDMFQVYDEREADGLHWYMIAPGEWVDSRHVSLVYPMSEPPQGVDGGRWIEINLYEQTMTVYENGQMIYATLTSTGLYGWWTRPGLFNIYEKQASTPMSGSFEADRADYYYLDDVPFTMYFDESRAFHGAFWHQNYGFRMSHGCANLSPADSQWLFNWAEIGDPVYIWDPSGETPTDPSLYGAGGA